jgi:hypothetical protein
MPLGDHSVLNENCGRAHLAGHKARRIIPGVRVVFRTATECDTDGIFLFSAPGAPDPLDVTRARGRRISQKHLLQVPNVNAHLKSRGAAQEIDPFVAELFFDLPGKVFFNLRRVLFGFQC